MNKATHSLKRSVLFCKLNAYSHLYSSTHSHCHTHTHTHTHDRRNDFISVVRNAARTALEKMDVPEAKEVLRVTKVLEDEIEALEGGHVAV